jgi:hypothetical protein
MRIKILSILALSAFAVSAAADEGFKISGDVATSIFIDDTKGNNAAFPNAAGATYQVENPNGDFSVDLVEINLEKTVGNSGMVLGIGYGAMGSQINSIFDQSTIDTVNTGTGAGGLVGRPKPTLNLTNAYFHHKVGETGLTLKIGRFTNEFGGMESYRYADNMNYTRSYAFALLNPWFLTGVQANYMINEMFDVGVVVANSTQNMDLDENRGKVAGVNFTAKPMEGLNVKLSYLMGQDGDGPQAAGVGPLPATGVNDVTRMNATVGYTLNSMYDFAIHYASLNTEPVFGGTGDKTATSVALYAGAKMEMWGAGLRYEMFDDGDGLYTVADNAHNVITATGWYNLDQNASVKLEVASTSADKKVFDDDKGAAGTEDSMLAYGLGFLYRF